MDDDVDVDDGTNNDAGTDDLHIHASAAMLDLPSRVRTWNDSLRLGDLDCLQSYNRFLGCCSL